MQRRNGRVKEYREIAAAMRHRKRKRSYEKHASSIMATDDPHALVNAYLAYSLLAIIAIRETRSVTHWKRSKNNFQLGYRFEPVSNDR